MMKHRHTGFIGIACFTLLLVLPPELFAQQATDVLRIRRIEGNTSRAPQYQVTGGTRTTRQSPWLEVRTEFEVAPEWLDEVTFTYYIVLRNRRPREGEAEYNLFRGENTYVNVARTRTGQSSVYLHPSTLQRYGDLERVGVVVSSQGRVLGMASNPSSEQRWWEQLPPRAGFVLNRMQTPWAMVNFDDYEAMKPSER